MSADIMRMASWAGNLRGLLRVRTLRQALHELFGVARYPEQDHRTHLRACVDWLGRAQSARRDGVVASGWSFELGWLPDTDAVGARLIETLVPAANYLSDAQLLERAGLLADVLLARHDTAVPDRVLGLIAVHRQLHCAEALPRALASARLLTLKSIDAAADIASCARALAAAGCAAQDASLLDVARSHVAAALQRQTPCGWFQDEAAPASTLALGATLHDLVEAAVLLNDDATLERVRRAAGQLAGQLTAEGRLAGAHDDGWTPVAGHVCVAGLARMACVWIRLARIEGRREWQDAAWRALAWIKRTQRMLGNDPVRDGIPSTAPSWAGPRAFQLETLTVKYFADALMMDMTGIVIPPIDGCREIR